MSSKIDGFDGSASDYIRYLENIVRSFREPHPSCPICAPHRRTHHEPYQNTPSEPRREATPEQPKEYSPSLKRSPSIEIIEFDPKQELNEQPARSNKDRRISVPSWKERALLLIEETPAASAWTKKLKEIGIYDAMCSGKAVSSLLNWEFDSRPSTGTQVDLPTTQSQDSSPLVFAERYARISMQNEVAASVAMALANYQKFLVLSSCAVLVGTNTPAEDVYRIVRICMGNDASDKHCQRILRGCKFVNALLDRLYMGGWGLRAYELLLIWNKNPNFYLRLSYSYNESFQLLQNQLCTKELTANIQPLPSKWTSIFPPKIIYEILGEQLQIGEIAKQLGYIQPGVYDKCVNAFGFAGSAKNTQISLVL